MKNLSELIKDLNQVELLELLQLINDKLSVDVEQIENPAEMVGLPFRFWDDDPTKKKDGILKGYREGSKFPYMTSGTYGFANATPLFKD